MSRPLSNEPTVRGDRTPDAVLGLLREQRSLYTELESLASKQRSLITGDDPTRLLELLAKRQLIASSLSKVAQRFEPMKRDWEAIRAGFDSNQRLEAEHLLDDIRVHLRRVIDGDEQDARLLSARKEATAGALRKSHSNQSALNAYQTPRQDAGTLNCLDGA